MTKRTVSVKIALSVVVLLQMAMLGGCGGMGHSNVPEAEAPVIEIEEPSAPVSDSGQSGPETAKEETEPEREAGASRKGGERFEGIIMIEGMEEAVRLEHVRNEEIGFEMDYDYESFNRITGPGKESFVSVYDDETAPENYLEITYVEENPDIVEASADEELSAAYDKTKEQYTLDNAGSCTMINASTLREKDNIPYFLQSIYIIPAGTGSIVAREYCTLESVEGFGSRFSYMMNSLSVIGRNGESGLSEEQAIEAIKKYCFSNNPDLEAMTGSDDHTIYWEASTNDAGEIVVLYRSYTGAQIRYYIDPDSGKTRVTETVPGITDEEQSTDESLNVMDYID